MTDITKKVLLLLALLTSLSSLALTSKSAVEATMTYQGEMMVSYNEFQQMMTDYAASEDQILGYLLEKHVSHIFGSLAHNSTGIKGVPKTDHEYLDLDVERTPEGYLYITYQYQGTVLLSDSVGDTVSFFLPVDPINVYYYGISNNSNPCTDAHYQSEGDFWYFWNPTQYGCKLQKGVHYVEVTAQLVKKDSSVVRYPEYDRLVQKSSDGFKNVIPVSLFFGLDKPDHDTNLEGGVSDANKSNVRAVIEWLLQAGYEEMIPQTRSPIVDALLEANGSLYRWFKKETPEGQMLIKIFFGRTGIDELADGATLFHSLYLDALAEDSVVMYAGHSGLGGHLNVDSLFDLYNRFEMRQDYQILFFNSCSSYPYYNQMYFNKKAKGSKDLDIITNGLATYFTAIDDSLKVVLAALDAWSAQGYKMSYQEIADMADSNNLFAVVGDEDN